jgi:phosphoribosyl 1,2-cyclic phosphodiesterase
MQHICFKGGYISMGGDFLVTFWGVRGSLPVPGADTCIYGGNTPCVQIQIKERLLILDAGTGIFKLGRQLDKQNSAVNADIFITHVHWDHIQGFPFFSPAFRPGNKFTIYGQKIEGLSLEDIFKGQMTVPYFPITLQEMQANIRFYELDSNEHLNMGDGIVVKTLGINHPGGCLAYRIEHQGRSCCYVTDTEHSMPADLALQALLTKRTWLSMTPTFQMKNMPGMGTLPPKKDGGIQPGRKRSSWQIYVKPAAWHFSITLIFAPMMT